MKKIVIIISMIILYGLSYGETVDIKIAKTTSGVENYIQKLLKASLGELGYDVNMTFSSDELGFERGLGSLESGDIDLFWSGNTDRANDKIYYIDIPMTNNLLGKRIIFIPKGDAHFYKDIYTVEDIRNSGKVGGFGRGWADVDIWKANNIPYFEKQNGNWEAIFIMMAKKTRGIDYFSRGVIEIIPELENIIKKNNYALEVEPNLLFQYKLDFFIYVNKKNEELNKLIEEALIHARDTGLMDKIVEEYWKKDFETLHVKDRRVIEIKN